MEILRQDVELPLVLHVGLSLLVGSEPPRRALRATSIFQCRTITGTQSRDDAEQNHCSDVPGPRLGHRSGVRLE